MDQLVPVIQEDATGCGIACCATLAGIGYAEAKRVAKRLGIDAADPRLWSDTAYVRRLLVELGIGTADKEHPFNDWDKLPDRALLAIKWHLEAGKPFWHWVCFVRYEARQYVLDPKKDLKKNLRTDLGRIKPRWFIPVIGPT